MGKCKDLPVEQIARISTLLTTQIIIKDKLPGWLMFHRHQWKKLGLNSLLGSLRRTGFNVSDETLLKWGLEVENQSRNRN